MSKFYVVWKGRTPGIYTNWKDCNEQINGFSGQKFKSYLTYEEAVQAYESPPIENKDLLPDNYITDSITVDASCIGGNPGKIEYQGLWVNTKEVIFKSKVYDYGTNNMGEFLGIVHALAHCKKFNISVPIYSDSKIAISWVKNKKVNFNKKAKYDLTKEVFSVLSRAETWLKENDYPNQVLKWDNRKYGENFADYGRK